VTTPEVRPFCSATAGFKSGSDTPRAFLDRCLKAVDEFEPGVGAFVHMDIAGAKASADRSAQRWRSGKPLSRIDGMPIGIKDIIETVDMPTQMGSPLYDNWRSGRDAASVAALREAGAVILGKTVTTEFAATVPRGTRNPWDPRRTPGGSSSGSAAAVATGMVSAALGTQVIGSILRPASFCGCVGFKPTIGAINRGGSHDGLSQSAHGPLAASLEDAWIVAREIADRAGGDPGFAGLYGATEIPSARKPARLAVLETTGWAVAEPAAKAAFEASVARIKAAGVDVIRRAGHRGTEDVESAIVRAMETSRQINAWESIWPLNTYRSVDATKLSKVMLARMGEGEAMSLDDYRALLVERERIRARYASFSVDCDAVLTLSAPGAAPMGLESTGNPVFNVPATLLGVPALSLPLMAVDGLPLGLQAIGFHDRDAALFSVAAWLVGLLSKAA
jgi:Asp-tRNA(Asn)/Glu-tRNA(Gln) amidotransferase A subunit family amidase